VEVKFTFWKTFPRSITSPSSSPYTFWCNSWLLPKHFEQTLSCVLYRDYYRLVCWEH